MGNKLLRCLTVLLLFTFSNVSFGQSLTTTPIFSFGSAWKYLDDGSNQGTTWSSTGFNDAAWTTGTGHIGYGEVWTTTCIKAGATCPLPPNCNLTNTCNKYVTAYLRKSINISDVNLFDSVRFSVFMDDGIVMYVNGVEVWRNNMPTGTVGYTTLASGNIPESTAVTRSIPISYFTTGTNVIAVEVHQNAVTTSDMDFNAQALGVYKTNIVAYGSSWKYFSAATDPGASWLTTGFNDASWSSGTGHIGFGETWTTTCIPAGATCTGCIPGGSCTKYSAAYFRKSIILPDVSIYDSLRFSVFRDDGIVMYVNGAEVWRDNMPAAPTVINYSTLAPLNVGADYPESTAVVKSIPISWFTNGSNTIAIEVHQTALTSSDLDFNVQITGVTHVPAVPVTLSQGPYLQMGNQSAASIRWRTNVASKSRVQVGTVAGTYPIVVSDAASVTEHEVRVTGLTADTKYYYRIGTDTSIIQGDTANFFVTAPADGTTRRVTVAAFGDCGRNDNSFQTGSLTAYQNYLASQNMKAADLMLLIGDNAYDAGTDAEFSANFFSRYSGNVLKNHMLFPAPGNHDYANDATRQVDHNVPYYNLFSLPTAGQCGGVASGTEAYYSFNWGDVHFLSLDSYGEENAGTTRLYDTLGAQVTWIKNDLAANTKKWTVAYWHHPPYTMGSHNSNTETELVNIRQNFIRILERYGVDVIICGHSHDYERSYLLKGHYGNEASFSKAAHTADSSSAKYNGSANSCPYTIPSGKVNHGTVYVVSGSAGADGGVQTGYPHDALPFSIDDGGMFFLDIKDNRLDAKFLRRDNSTGDQFTIMKDVKVRDTITILHGQSVDLTASWLGAYAWAPGITARTISVTPLADTMITVKDSLTNTCITDQHYIDVQCTMPGFTLCPANITRSGCDNIISYAVTDTGRPAPVLTYSFSGATTGSGAGAGSGAAFSIGITTVTVTASNSCGSSVCTFTVTVNQLPVSYTVTGSGHYCNGGTGLAIGLDGSETGVAYQLYNGSTAIGTAVPGTGAAISFGTLTTSAAYTVAATQTASGCTSNMTGSATITIDPLPATFTVTGGGSYCLGGTGVPVGVSGSQSGINYQLYNGAATAGAPVPGTSSAITFGNITTPATYTVVATDAATGCSGNMTGGATVATLPLPLAHAVTGGGHYCAGGTGVGIDLAGSESGINYALYRGTTPVGTALPGTGSAVSFGMHTVAGTYAVLATNQTTGCTSNMTSSATVVVDPLPVAYSITGGGAYCAGGAGLPLNIAGSQTSISYQLYRGIIPVGAAFTGTGTPLSLGTYTTAGTYTIQATNLTTSCANTMSGSASISIDPLPAVYALTGGGSYCAGSAGVHIGLGGSTTGINYQLYLGTTPIGTANPGTGMPLDFGLLTGSGSYSVSAANAATSCAVNMVGTAAVTITPTVTPAVSVSTSTGTTVCAGTSVTFAASPVNGGAAPAYRWYVNGAPAGTSSSYTFSPTNGNIVSVKLTGNATCTVPDTAMASVTMTVSPNVMPNAIITAVPGNILCQGSPVTFTSTPVNGGTAPSFTWLKNSAIAGTGSTYSYTPADGDNIILFMSSNHPCRLTSSVYSNSIGMTIAERTYPSVVDLIVKPGIYLTPGITDTVTAVVTGGGANPTFKWIKNGIVIAGATSQTYISNSLVAHDSLACEVTGTGICGITNYNFVIFRKDVTAIDDASSDNQLTIRPNPTTGTFLLTGTISAGEAGITITNVLGQVIYRNIVHAGNGAINTTITLDNQLPDGIYHVSVTTSAGVKTFRITLKQ